MFWPAWVTRVNVITGELRSLNVSRGGIPKRPVSEAYLGAAGLDGDACANRRYHGGPMQAILLVTLEGIDELCAMGYALFPGALGDNLTTSGLDRRGVRIGDRYRAGEATIEITKLRVPCVTLNVYNRPETPPIQNALFDKEVKAGNFESPRWGLGGFYARVIDNGIVRVGDRIGIC